MAADTDDFTTQPEQVQADRLVEFVSGIFSGISDGVSNLDFTDRRIEARSPSRRRRNRQVECASTGRRPNATSPRHLRADSRAAAIMRTSLSVKPSN
jgi:hypothetical protein